MLFCACEMLGDMLKSDLIPLQPCSYVHYKPKLEKVMEQMLVLTEIGDLGSAVDDFEFDKVDNPVAVEQSNPIKSLLHDAVRAETSKFELTFSSRAMSASSSFCNKCISCLSFPVIAVVKNQRSTTESDLDEDKAEQEHGVGKETPWKSLRSAGSNDSSDEPNEVTNEKLDSAEGEMSPSTQEEVPVEEVHEPVNGLLRETSTTTQIKYLLDSWVEPVNKQDVDPDPTIHEILQFRKALGFLDDTHPFGSSFGPAFTRDLCIKSSKALYRRLLALSVRVSECCVRIIIESFDIFCVVFAVHLLGCEAWSSRLAI